ncbi:Serine/threonine-protein kinase PBL34 [Linum perenne]
MESMTMTGIRFEFKRASSKLQISLPHLCPSFFMAMGCFPVLMNKNKIAECTVSTKPAVSNAPTLPTKLPEPKPLTRFDPVNSDNRRIEILDAAEQDTIMSVTKEYQSLGPHPLPLPPPQHSWSPLPLPPTGTSRSFSYNDQCISEGLAKFISLASLRHPSLCRLVGFRVQRGLEERVLLVYEKLHHGSLDRILSPRSDGPVIDWNSRIKIALCAAQGLAFLHEEGPFQAMYSKFSSANIQIDKDFSAKLTGYGSSVAAGNLSSNVWSFGVILLELITGQKNQTKEERNLANWSRLFLSDDFRLSMIIDPRLKQKFPVKAARTVVNIALRCLHKDPLERPNMRTVAKHLKAVQDIREPMSRFPTSRTNIEISHFEN